MTDASYSARVLPGLKAFQRDTVDYVFKRMYEDAPPATRFLVADEVGLGKTLVARGLVARAIDRLQEEGVPRIDIVYICSNSAIARQNIKKLNLTGEKVHNLPDRITLLPRDVQQLRHRPLNFVAFTPGTSFNLRSSMGRYEERVLLYWLLADDWKTNEDGAISLLTGGAGRANFASNVRDFSRWYNVDEDIRADYRLTLEHIDNALRTTGERTLQERFVELAGHLGRRGAGEDERDERTFLVGRLRSLLATTCIKALEPDLVILDEFQRFKSLLTGTDPAAELARDLFHYSDQDGRQTRVLLLSATPYKMYTLNEEEGGDDHFADFIQTVGFLYGVEKQTARFREQIQQYRRGLFRYDVESRGAIVQAREAVEASLKQVMVRTERLASTPDRGGMLVIHESKLPVDTEDVQHYLAVQRVASAIEYGDTMEYWKSAPYVFNFMEDYELKDKFTKALAGSKSIGGALDALSSGASPLLSKADVEAYRQIDPHNARLRWLNADTVGRGTANWAWLPPSCWYYGPAAPFDLARAASFTKRLVFSSWQVVPKVVGALLSYEAERQMFGEAPQGALASNTEGSRKRRARRLVFGRRAGRPSAMVVLGMLYPSLTLAELGDPLQISSPARDGDAILPLSVEQVLQTVRQRVEPLLADLAVSDTDGDEDERWYWAAPILLDLHRHPESTREWFDQANLASKWQGDPHSGTELAPAAGETTNEEDRDDNWSAHVEIARVVAAGELALRRKPADLTEVLALLAVGSPAVAALRAICRVTGGLQAARHLKVRNAAGQVAESFRSLFNQPELTEAIRRASGEEPYWRRVVQYCVNGCLQAVLDEYSHLLADTVGARDASVVQTAEAIAREMTATLTLRSALLKVDFVNQSLDDDGRARATIDELSFRTGYAVRYGSRAEDGDSADRNRKLQDAFNSPFWPFVLCTTSVGQEGLDFHRYSHAVVHWNLPSNPVDLEQREGRVHRFKGHAVRKNVARVHAAAAGAGVGGDPWAHMFDAARTECGDADADLKPYWVYAPDGGSRIERHVPAYPLSRDARTADRLRRSLTVYRMAFGQARQEDLVAFLLGQLGTEEKARAAGADLQIDLSPPESSRRQESGGAVESLASPQGLQAEEPAPPEADARVVTVGSLGRFRRLLDDFCAIAPDRPFDSPRAAEGDESALLERLSTLLEAFAQLGGEITACGTASEETAGRVDVAVAQTLLDEFVHLRVRMADVGLLIRLQTLLDEYSRSRADASSPSQ
jgi:hypothetical protein